MKKNQNYINDYNNIMSVDSNFSLNDSIEANTQYLKITQKNGEIEMIVNEPYIDYNNINDRDNNNDHDNDNDRDNDNNDRNGTYVDDSADDLTEFSQYRDHDFESDDDLESTLDFKFDFDIIFTPEKNSELLQITEIKSKIVNRIKLNALDLFYIKKLDDNEKYDLIKLFNNMV
jgi:hypothetical protein